MIIKELKIGSVTLYNFDTEADGSEFYDGVDAKKLAEKYGFSIKEVEAKELKKQRYTRLEKIYAKKWLGIQAIAIGKPWASSKEYIEAQIKSYEELYKYALKILEQDKNNDTAKGIVTKHNEALAITFKVNLIMQQMRGKLEVLIENGDDRVDGLLDIAENIKLSKDELTDEKLQEIVALFEV